MQAVADSNLVKMATLWGTANGPASKTNQPPDWQRRIAIMQAYLRNDSFRVTSDEPETDVNRRGCRSRSSAAACTWSVPFTAVKIRDDFWIVTQLDLAAAGNPARPCLDGAPRDSAPQG